MGTVHVTSSHHNLYVRHPEGVDLSKRVLLDREVLARPILNVEERPLAQESQNIIRAAFQGLMDLAGFDATISFGLVEKEGLVHLIEPHRQWGEITLGSPENVIVGFSHDTRFPGASFRRVSQWCEEAPDGGWTSDEDYSKFAARWASSDKWLEFYKNRIRRKQERLLDEIYENQRKALKNNALMTEIEAALKLSYKR